MRLSVSDSTVKLGTTVACRVRFSNEKREAKTLPSQRVLDTAVLSFPPALFHVQKLDNPMLRLKPPKRRCDECRLVCQPPVMGSALAFYTAPVTGRFLQGRIDTHCLCDEPHRRAKKRQYVPEIHI